MAQFVVDVSGVDADLRNFPDGPIEATVKSCVHDISKASLSQMLTLEVEIYHPSIGTATIRDWLPSKFPAKVKSFWMAVNDFSAEEIASNPIVSIDPETIVGAQLLIHLGDQESSKDKKVYKTIVAPWYYPLSRAEELLPLELPL